MKTTQYIEPEQCGDCGKYFDIKSPEGGVCPTCYATNIHEYTPKKPNNNPSKIYFISHKHYYILDLYKYSLKLNNYIFCLNKPYLLRKQAF